MFDSYGSGFGDGRKSMIKELRKLKIKHLRIALGDDTNCLTKYNSLFNCSCAAAKANEKIDNLILKIEAEE